MVVRRVSTMDVRARIGDMLDRVALRHDEFVIERRGKPLAALVPVERLEQIRTYARQHALDFLSRQKSASRGPKLSDAEAMELALAGQRQVRSSRRRSTRTARRRS
jgi:prevent-host-death family protein